MSSNPSSPYAVLGLLDTADLATAKAAYKVKVLTTHPDQGGDPAEFLVLQDAWDRIRAGWTPPAAATAAPTPPPAPPQTTRSTVGTTYGTPHRTGALREDDPPPPAEDARPSRRQIAWGLAPGDRRLTTTTAWAVLLHVLQAGGVIGMPASAPPFLVPDGLYEVLLVVAPWTWVATLVAVTAWAIRSRARTAEGEGRRRRTTAAAYLGWAALAVALSGWTVVIIGWGLIVAVAGGLAFGALWLYGRLQG